jgi:Phage terminase large subunit (GpA)
VGNYNLTHAHEKVHLLPPGDDYLTDYDESQELSDEELAEIAAGDSWCPEPVSITESDFDFTERKTIQIPPLSPSRFTEFAFRMIRPDGLGYENFSFEGRRHMHRLYDTPARRILLKCGRQVEKSTLLGNRMLTYSCMVPGFRTLYVSPSATQTKTFSVDRIKEPLETSNVLRGYTTTALQQNVFEKQFVNRSKITLRYAFLNADRCRGIPAWSIMLDELQDILADNIPVIEQASSHAPENWKSFIYAGTPKSLDGTLEYYWSGTARGKPMSTMGEWMVPCDRCGSSAGTGRYWNILGEKNIQKKGLSCERCGKPIDPMGADAQWAMTVKGGVFEAYRIPQLMVPWRSWDEIMLDYGRYDRQRFYNEVLGISYDSGLRPLTRAQVRSCSNPDVHMDLKSLEKYKTHGAGNPIFVGLDWGTGENSYTVISFGTYVSSKFRIFYIHRFQGEEVDPQIQLQRIVELIGYFNTRLIGADYGGGFHPNDHLTRKFGPKRVHKYQYLPRGKKKIAWNPAFRRWQVVRTEAMSDLFNAIKRRQIEFPNWEEFEDPFANDMLNIYSEYNNKLRMLQYDHQIDRPDDAFHSVLYCFLASMLLIPRPDIMAPFKEVDGQGPIRSFYRGPVDQG